jgi:hypothetical protein
MADDYQTIEFRLDYAVDIRSVARRVYNKLDGLGVRMPSADYFSTWYKYPVGNIAGFSNNHHRDEDRANEYFVVTFATPSHSLFEMRTSHISVANRGKLDEAKFEHAVTEVKKALST